MKSSMELKKYKFEQTRKLETEILSQLKQLKFNG